MKCIDVEWHQSDNRFPIRMVSELGEQGYEARKLEFFPDGRIGYAFGAIEYGGTMLGTAPVPSLEEINEQGEFSAREISMESFEALWNKHVANA
jgi:hypothetical protein